jgi:hypothetical protein
MVQNYRTQPKFDLKLLQLDYVVKCIKNEKHQNYTYVLLFGIVKKKIVLHQIFW